MAFLLHQLLSESAARYPDREAIVFKDRIITYSKLERESNKLSHTLIKYGIAKGDRVGLYMDRGIESLIAACGVLKVGAAYVPINTASPLIRVNYIIEKCGIRSLLINHDKLPKIEASFPENSSLDFIVLMGGSDSDPVRFQGTTQIINGYSAVPDELGDCAPDVNIIDSDIAYILFTSGSTGNPKGVMLSHLNSLTFVKSACDFFHIEKEDKLSNIAPLHFDMSVFDIFVAFKAGACVVAIPEVTAIFPVKLAGYISAKKISIWNSVPSALTLLATNKNLK